MRPIRHHVRLSWLLVLLLLCSAARAEPTRYTAWEGAHWPARERQFRVATFNMHNLFRYGDPPGVSPTKGQQKRDRRYYPGGAAAYQRKLAEAARTILNDLGSPDVVALQEVENMRSSFSVHNPNTRFGADQPRVIQDLLAEISRQSGRRYAGAGSPKFSDRRGISQWFLYDTSRVRMRRARPVDPLFGARSQDPYSSNHYVRNPKSFNAPAPAEVQADKVGRNVMTRPLLVGLFEVYRDGVARGGPSQIYTVLNTHQKSNPTRFQTRRWCQSKLCAHLVRDIHRRYPRAKVVVTGDFNLDLNNPRHQAQAGPLADLTRRQGNRPPLLHALSLHLPQNAYTYVYNGQGNQLDWMLASPSAASGLVDLRIAHIGTTGRTSFDHDPVVASFQAF